jgi:hypothetical protein
MRYIDLMGGQKPHLLVSTTNNMSAETEVGARHQLSEFGDLPTFSS